MYYIRCIEKPDFEWDERKNLDNIAKHGAPFDVAQLAFLDELRVFLSDPGHCEYEKRFFCLGDVGGGIITVRFTMRGGKIRIFGAGYWRKGRKRYENSIHR